MRILVLTTDAFGALGGIALYNRDVLRALCAHPRVTEVVCVPRHAPGDTGPLPDKLHWLAEGASGKRAFVVQALMAGRSGRFDLVVCGHLNLLPVAWALHVLHRAPLCLLIYGIEAWKAPAAPLVAELARRVHAFVSISDITRRRFLDWAAPRRAGTGFLLPNAIHRADYAPGDKPAALLDRYGLRGRRVLMTLARLDAAERYKGLDEVMECLPELPADVVYLVCGDGTDRARLADKARALGVAERVVFAGRISEQEKADHYRVSDAFVMPGRGEGFGFVFLEALACGIPVVASAVDGSREAVRDGLLGRVVDPDDRGALLAALRGVLDEPRGVVPEGLSYFDYPRFQARCHQVVDAVLPGAGVQAGSVP